MKIVVLTGAGMSAESGIATFRGSGGLWEGHRVEDVASPEGWRKDKKQVLRFYNERRQQIRLAEPNKGHYLLSALESDYDIQIITQNIDDLHERAGSTKVLHLHGEIMKSRSERYEELIYPQENDIQEDDVCERGYPLRPHIVWFGEAVPLMDRAIHLVEQADMMVIIGTSMLVYPAASLVHFKKHRCSLFVINPDPGQELKDLHARFIQEGAVKGIEIWSHLIKSADE